MALLDVAIVQPPAPVHRFFCVSRVERSRGRERDQCLLYVIWRLLLPWFFAFCSGPDDHNHDHDDMVESTIRLSTHHTQKTAVGSSFVLFCLFTADGSIEERGAI